MKNTPENFNEKQTEQLNNLLSKMPELAEDKKLSETAELDNARLEWARIVAELLAETKTSLETLMTSEEMDLQRIKWWMEQAGIDFEKHNENKQ